MRFETVLEEAERLPEPLQNQVESVAAKFEKFAAHHREPWLPSTNNQLENYYKHTQPPRVEHRFQSPPRLLAFLDRQMSWLTVTQGLVSRDTSAARASELFPDMELEAIPQLFSESKQHFLHACDIDVG